MNQYVRPRAARGVAAAPKPRAFNPFLNIDVVPGPGRMIEIGGASGGRFSAACVLEREVWMVKVARGRTKGEGPCVLIFGRIEESISARVCRWGNDLNAEGNVGE